MRLIIQKVKTASCTVDKKIIGKIDYGFLILVGFTAGDNLENIDKAIKKIINLRIFPDEAGKMNLNIQQVGGSILSISQFTLYANTNEGNRPSFSEAMRPDEATKLYDEFNNRLKLANINVEVGIFGSHMEIALINDGPVTIALEF